MGDHWTLLIVRELTLNKCLTFTELMVAVRGISTNILSHRLHELVYQRVLTVDQSSADGRKQFYSLSPIGADLRPVIRSIDHWGREYSTEIAGIGKMNLNPRQRFLWRARSSESTPNT
jgi:DNA-binding HxlR family transcriptional regulator